MKIELHLLQNFPPSCLNRDDTGQPKDCEFGGYRRARISSQALKRSIRWHPTFCRDLEATFARRSAYHAHHIAALLAENPQNPRSLQDSIRVSRYILQRMGFKEKKGRLAVMPLLGDDEINVLAQTASTHWDLLYPRANESILWQQLAERLSGWINDEFEEDSGMLGQLIAYHRAGKANASQLAQWLNLPRENWTPVLESLSAIPDELVDELRKSISVEERAEEKDEDEDEYVPKQAAKLFAGNKNKEVSDRLKTVTLEGVKGSAKKDDQAKEIGKLFKPLKKLATQAVNVALFGRMLAEVRSGEMHVDAACQVAHAISTNRITMEFDYFTAVDDLRDLVRSQGVEQVASVGMIGTVAYNSSCFYRYSVIDWEQLLKNLAGDTSLARNSVSAFMRASVHAIPTGKQNTFAAHAKPGFVLAVVRKSGPPVSLANAFLRPVQPRDWGKQEERRDLLEASAEALASHWIELGAMYGHNGLHTKAACWMPQGLRLEAFDDCRAADNRFDSVVNQALQALPGMV